MTITIEKRDDQDWVVHSDLNGWARPATPDESALWGHKDARIAELEKLLTECLNTNENEHMDPDLVTRVNRALMESVTK